MKYVLVMECEDGTTLSSHQYEKNELPSGMCRLFELSDQLKKEKPNYKSSRLRSVKIIRLGD